MHVLQLISYPGVYIIVSMISVTNFVVVLLHHGFLKIYIFRDFPFEIFHSRFSFRDFPFEIFISRFSKFEIFMFRDFPPNPIFESMATIKWK